MLVLGMALLRLIKIVCDWCSLHYKLAKLNEAHVACVVNVVDWVAVSPAERIRWKQPLYSREFTPEVFRDHFKRKRNHLFIIIVQRLLLLVLERVVLHDYGPWPTSNDLLSFEGGPMNPFEGGPMNPLEKRRHRVAAQLAISDSLKPSGFRWPWWWDWEVWRGLKRYKFVGSCCFLPKPCKLSV